MASNPAVMTDIFRRLANALPQVLRWVDELLDENAAAATRVDSLAFKRLPLYWPAEVLRSARAVNTTAIPFPPVSAYGLPEFAALQNMPMAGITFRDVFFIDPTHASEAVHFHELVHIVQWAALGPSPFLLTYGVGLAQFGYVASPLEAIAYDLQDAFERGTPLPGIKRVVEQHAFQAREAAALALAQHGIVMGSGPTSDCSRNSLFPQWRAQS
jgi:hypothetical protein